MDPWSNGIIRLGKVPDYARTLLAHGSIGNHPMLVHVPHALRMKVINRVALGRREGFCYFRVPKVANSTIIKSLLGNMPSSKSCDIPSESAKLILQGIPTFGELESLFVFTFVRHPASRTLSAFLDKSRDLRLRKKHPCLLVESGTVAGFRRFLDQLEDGQLLDNIHWAPQTSILPWQPEKYDFIGKYETFDKDLMFCMSRIFGENVELLTHSPHRTGADELLKEFISSRDRQLIERLFSRDFEMFYPNG